ncbi:MAG: hydrolase, partial [Sinomicrobium sp.]|nr:hydrolase [Sinomicrobium sp.]
PKRFAFGGNFTYNSENHDYFEPRIEGKFVTFSSNLGGNVWVSSDYRKKFAYDVGIGGRTWSADPQNSVFLDISPRYRFSDKFLVVWRTELSKNFKNFGYIDDDGTDVFLGQRNITGIENALQAGYNFDPYKAINVRFRNFWSTAHYKDNIFFILNDDGTRAPIAYDISENDPNTNFNIWNIDLSFNWRFSPGSEAVLLYRNQIFNEDTLSHINYRDSLDNLFKQPVQHTLSLRIVYFLDVNNIKNAF